MTDGTQANTHMVKDIAPFGFGSNPGSMKAFDGKLFFSASNYTDPGSGAASNNEVWESDGTEAGTKLVMEINPAYDGNLQQRAIRGLFTQMGNTLYHWAFDPTYGGELYKTTPSGGPDNPDHDGRG